MNRNNILLATLCLLTISPEFKQFEAEATQIQIPDLTMGLTVRKFYQLCYEADVYYVDHNNKIQIPAQINCELSEEKK